MKNEDVVSKVKQLQNDANALGGYLIEVAKSDPQAVKYCLIYEQLLTSESWYLRKVGVYALLFAFKLKDEKYIEKAISFLSDADEDDEVRRWSAIGLSSVFTSTKNPKILKVFNDIVEDPQQEGYIRIGCLEGILYVLGLNSTTILARRVRKPSNQGDDFKLDANLREFENEIILAKKIIQAS